MIEMAPMSRRRRLGPAALGLLMTCVGGGSVLSAQDAPADRAASCAVTADQRAEARRLAWQEFDQTGGAPGSFRALSDRGCMRAALAAYADWLEHGVGFRTERERAIGTFHRAQVLAFTGAPDEALGLMRTAWRDSTTADPTARVWNTYLDGVIGFFEHNPARIGAARVALRKEEGEFAQRQAGVLHALLNCVGESYGVAMSPRCRLSGG